MHARFDFQVYAAVGSEDVTAKDVHKAFKNKYKYEDLETVFGEDNEYDTGRQLAKDFVQRIGISKLPQV